jgi:hypothetical protein
MIQQKVRYCLKCGSFNILKKGKNRDNKQRYFCNDCKRYFQPKISLPSWVKKAYDDYVFRSMIYKDLVIKYKKSIPTLTKYFDLLNNLETEQYINDVNNKKKSPIAIPISLIFDATFFKRNK